jgi:hypothetical protein
VSPAAHAQDARTQDARHQASRDADGPIPQLVKFVGNILPGSNASEPARRAGREPRASRPSRGVERQAVAAQMPAVAMPLPPRRPNEVDGVEQMAEAKLELAPAAEPDRDIDIVPSAGSSVFVKLLPFRLGEDIEPLFDGPLAKGPLPPRRPGSLVVALAPSQPELAQREDAPRQDLNLFARILPDSAPDAPERPADGRQAPILPEGPIPPRRPPHQKVAAVPRELNAAPKDDVAARDRDPLNNLPQGNARGSGGRSSEPGEVARQQREGRPSRLLPGEVAMMAQRSAYTALIAKHANEHGVPLILADAVVRIESGYNPLARNGPNYGLTQINYQTAKSLGYGGTIEGLYDAETNLRYGMRYLGMAYRLANGDTCGTILKYQGGHQAQSMTSTASTYCARARAIIAAAR